MAKVFEKNAMMFFVRGMEVEVKNLVKMFESKYLKQAYTLVRLHDKTLTHKCFISIPNKKKKLII